jgi:ABC-type nitrate/sulfonate/bicarbonate transport system permease component
MSDQAHTSFADIARRIFEPLALCLAIAVLWEGAARLWHWDASFVPPPSKVVLALWEFRGQLTIDSVFTFLWILGGFSITVIAALITAVAIHSMPGKLSRPIYGVLVMLQSVPVFAITPVITYWAGTGVATRLILIVLVAFFPVLANTAEGMQHLDPDLVDLFVSMNATKAQRLLKLELPSALAMIAAGIKITLTMCAIGVVVAEMAVGEMTGLGYRPKEALSHFRVDEAFASVLLLVLIVVALYHLLHQALAKFYPSRSSL